MGITIKTVAAWLIAVVAVHAHALQIISLSPQGEIARVRQVVAKFDDNAVNFGDPKAPAPLSLSCSDAQATKGSGRWINEREWAYEFQNDLPPGVRCTVQVVGTFQSPKNQPVSGKSTFVFTTGGPFVQNIRPGTYQPIDEEQYFVLQLNGPATAQSMREGVWCTTDGLGERVPVKLIEGRDREDLLKSLGLESAAAKDPQRIYALTCNRRLTPGSQMQLVFGKGVSTPSGVPNSVERRFSFRVREPFAASFNCERENAQSACLPIRAMSLSFNAPVSRKLAAAIRLKSDRETLKPDLGEDGAGEDAVVNAVNFRPLFTEQTRYRIELPSSFKDASGRTLRNADSFPLQVGTGPMPPLVKFPVGPFGIVERFAEPDAKPGDPALLPVTVRNVEARLQVQGLQAGAASASKVSELQVRHDADVIAWFRKVQRYDDSDIPRNVAANDSRVALPSVTGDHDRHSVQSRMVSLLGGQPGVKTLDLPRATGDDPRPFEVVGIPLAPGFHVVEIASQKLGTSLLDERYGRQRTMYVRTAALVTNLGVHFKLGREDSMVWVTTLDKGKPVAGAVVRVSDCRGEQLFEGSTDPQGRITFSSISSTPPHCGGEDYRNAYFVSARAKVDDVEELAFTWSDWQKGIEPWRFNVPTSLNPRPDERVHTIFDRPLFRAGETVSMKHIMRTETSQGFGLPEALPSRLVITHVGSGQQYTQPIEWRKTATGGQSADNTFAIPPAAKLGIYQVQLSYDGSGPGSYRHRSHGSGQFRVEEYRLPVLEGRVVPENRQALVKVKSVPVNVQVNYVAGGAAANLPVRVSALVRTKAMDYGDYKEFSFTPPRGGQGGSSDGEEERTAAQDQRVIADKLPLVLDRQGAGKLTIDNVPQSGQPRELLLEATYADPNGEVQTIRSTSVLWPAAVVAGIKTEGWVSTRQKLQFHALALNLAGKPAVDVALEVTAVARIVTTSRKRMVGGFYTYDNKTEIKNLGSLCSGKSDARGLLLCEAELGEPGEVELVVTARDRDGNRIQAARSVYVTRQGELWFGGENHDRMDLLPEKKSYQPGETAKFQVRMPFRFATALVTVEREGIIDSQVVQLNGQDPTVSLQVKEGWGPNVYVSVLALRGRLREVPWYSFFTWGYKAPREWWTSFWYEGREYVAPTALVDLSKPAFRLGLAEIRVGTKGHQLDVSVKADKESYPVRAQARVTITARLPNGRPAANAEVALAAVDQALLELMPNNSWDLLSAMLQRRSWGVSTATAQMEIIGRRHYGRKAVPAGGDDEGGSRSRSGGNIRELLDTLLLWNPRLKLDANGQAVVNIPLNDALTTFRIVAVADASTGLFGTGQTTVRSTQDLQIISGLPPLVREDDQFRAQVTLRNTTQAAMKVEVSPRATMLDLKPQTIDIPAGEAREAAWLVTAPAQLALTRVQAILWEIEAKDLVSGARDALKASQRILPAVPLTVQQATLVQLDGPLELDVNPPADALPGRGGLKLSLQPRLAEGMDGVRDWFANYPFICLEQKTSKAVGLRDGRLWQTVLAQLPTYLDSDGLASYFPPRAGDRALGSDTLTAYLLAATHEAASINPAFAISDEVRAPMERGLIAFVEGRIQRNFWSPDKDLDVRKLAALEALSRYGQARGRMLGSITIAPNQWPTHAVIDWYNILRRVSDVPQREQRLIEAGQVLRARLSYQGTKLIFSTERSDYWWWLMVNSDVNTARLLLAVMDDPAWKDDMGRLANGFIARQQKGAWHTTTANLWGGLALDKFSARFESTPVTGVTRAGLAAANASVDWSRVERIKTSDPTGAAHQASVFGAPAAPGNLRNNSMFLPWNAQAAKDTLSVRHQGSGKPWLTLQSIAAVQLKEPFNAGYQIRKTITPVEQAVKGVYTRGDVLRITLEVNASADMTWVVISDPVPGGATILGGGLGRDSEIATSGEKRAGAGWPAFEERSFEAYRSYYQYLPKGTVKMEYTLRLNNVGDFALPPSRVEAMYAPEMFGEAPNERVKVEPVK